MNNVMAMTALAASLLVSSAAIAAPANLADALQPASGLTLVKLWRRRWRWRLHRRRHPFGGGGGPFGDMAAGAPAMSAVAVAIPSAASAVA